MERAPSAVHLKCTMSMSVTMSHARTSSAPAAQTRTADGFSLADDAISDELRRWNRRMGGPAERTSSGFYKGISVVS